MGKGLLTESLDWISHPFYGNETMLEWFMGLIAVLVLAFLWATVVKLIGE